MDNLFSNRLELAASASPIRMQQFTLAMHLILRNVEVICPGVSLTPSTNMDRVADAGMINRRELEGLIEELQGPGWGFLKKVSKLLGEPRNRA
ncbi:hypothetical protein VP01_1655g3 [Puccinia sorghi]|uniref:Uncharacterized protein n=1 Tax=Puccinia sorghi TaxID=27349 RepID=A0A0L6VGH5_9BASI|nr:hypothetical protein VP01_1655g3 [Puccinia sorghi]